MDALMDDAMLSVPIFLHAERVAQYHRSDCDCLVGSIFLRSLRHVRAKHQDEHCVLPVSFYHCWLWFRCRVCLRGLLSEFCTFGERGCRTSSLDLSTSWQGILRNSNYDGRIIFREFGSCFEAVEGIWHIYGPLRRGRLVVGLSNFHTFVHAR